MSRTTIYIVIGHIVVPFLSILSVDPWALLALAGPSIADRLFLSILKVQNFIFMSYIFEKTLLDIQKSKQKWTRINCLISFSGGQDSVNLLILWINLLLPLDVGAFDLISKSNQISIVCCNHLWKTTDFYFFRHSLQLSFMFDQRFFYTVFFSKYFSEQKARKFRYFLFLRIAKYSSSQLVITAHTRNDNIETFFLNLFRGSGKFGLKILRNFQIFLNSECSQKFD